MKKIFTFLVAFLTTVSGAVWGQYQDLCDGPIRINDDKTYYITCSGQTNNGITVEEGSAGDKNEPTIYLKDININVGGSGIIISNYSTVKLILEGTNTIVSNGEDAAIDLGNRDASATEIELIIDESSTGILNIQTANNDDVAIGNCYAGGNMSPCGSLTVRGGTINTNGRIGHFTGHAFRFGGNAIVIANDIEGFDHNDKDMRRGGLLFLNDDTPNVGEFHTPEQDPEFTLSSPLPEPYKIEVRSGGVEVTIGEGQSLTESQVDLQGGTLNAYKVVYDMNKPANLTDVNPATVSSIYCGANTPLATIDPTLNPVDTYHYFGWANGNNITTQTDGDTPNQVEEVNAKAVWVVASKKVTTEKGSAIEEFSLVYPETITGINFTLAESTSLPDALTNNTNKIAGTLNASGTTKYTASYGEKSETVTLTFEATETKIDLEEEGAFVLQVKDLTYNGMVQTPSVQVLDVVEGENLDLNANYTVSYEPSEVKDAQQYTVTVTGKGAYKGTLTETFNVNKANAEVMAENVEWTIGDGEGPDFSKALSATGVGEDELTVASFTQPTGPWTTAGVYKVIYTDIKLNDDLAGNYNEVADVEGTLTVKKNGGEGEEEINPGDPDGEDTEIIPGTDTDQDGWEWVANKNRYERTYDGESHPLSTISLKYKNEDGETAWETLSSDEFSVEYSSTPVKDVVKAGYTATITITGSKYYSGTATMTLYINPRPMVIDINKLTAEDVAGITAEAPVEIGTDDVTFKAVEGKKESGIVEKEKEDAVVVGTITVTPAESTEEGKKAYTITVEEDDFKLYGAEGGEFTATNYTATYTYNGKSIDGEAITETIDDLEPGDVIPDDGDDDGNEWSWDAQGTTYALVYDGKGHGVESVTVKDETGETIDNAELKSVVYSQGLDEGGYAEMGEGELPTDAGMYQAEVVVSVNGESKTATIPLFITYRPLRVDFDLTNLDESAIGETLSAEEYDSYENNGENEGLVSGQTPDVEGKFHVADTSNDNGKYDITAEGVKLSDTETFASSNYSISYYVNGELLTETDGNGDYEGTIDGDDGADINEDYSGGTINTRQYRLYLANKDYNVADAKTDYADEGLELFSRHDKKYTKVGGSFTVWYEKDGVANAGGYRIFWSNRANGEYKEVKFDTVSEYFQIRNVQSDVYVKIYAADGFPVGNEEISAADYRAYAQPNKIVVITPQPTDVQIISMAGAVVATDKVTGQREFANLTEGVYIVRMGETVVKLQVRK